MSKTTGKIRSQVSSSSGSRSWYAKLPWARASIVLGLVLIAAGYAVVRIQSMADTEKQLQQMKARYAWNHTTFDQRAGEKPSVTRRVLAKYLGNALVSDVSRVKITENDVVDRDLTVLENLPHLKSLNLASNRATDKTLRLISQLPDLRYLSLAGSQFSIYGLLQLRDAHQLRELRLDLQQLSPSDVAVLKSQLPRVNVSDGNEPEEPHRMLFPVAGGAS